VEVVPVLDPSEKFAFDGLVAQLGLEDPRFVARVGRLARPRRRLRLVLAILLWTIAPVCIVLGGWTGLVMAVVAVAYGVRLYVRSKAPGAQAAWWPSHRKPEAPSL
jgi:peptidoglycan/LPS O-acetylase OafA/YrhL